MCFLLMVLHTKKGSLLTTIIATTGPRKTQMKWSSVESQHLIEREEETDLHYDIILEHNKFLVCNVWNPSVDGESKLTRPQSSLCSTRQRARWKSIGWPISPCAPFLPSLPIACMKKTGDESGIEERKAHPKESVFSEWTYVHFVCAISCWMNWSSHSNNNDWNTWEMDIFCNTSSQISCLNLPHCLADPGVTNMYYVLFSFIAQVGPSVLNLAFLLLVSFKASCDQILCTYH